MSEAFDRDAMKELLKEILEELIDESMEETSVGITIDDSTGLLSTADKFDTVAAFVRAAEDELESYNYKWDVANAYGLMANLIEMAVEYEVLDEGEDWMEIASLFHDRSVEMIDICEPISVDGLEVDFSQATDILDRLVSHFSASREYALRDGKYAAHEKLYTLRSFLISLRNTRDLPYDEWLKILFHQLSVDWQLLGGGFANTFTGGSKPYSVGGQ